MPIAFELAFYGFAVVPLQWKLSYEMGLKAEGVSLFFPLSAITTGSIIIVLFFLPRSVTKVKEGQPIMEDLDLASSAA